MNRRDFFKLCGRTAGVGLLASGSAALLRRPRKQLSGQNCINKGICRNCNTFSKCNLPQAQSAKQVLRRRNNG